MRKLFVFLLAAIFLTNLHAEENYNKYLHQKLSSYGRWSTSFELGLSRFDGDFNTTKDFFKIYPQTIRGFFSSPNVAGNVEYSLHPNFGFGLALNAGYMTQENLTATETVKFYYGTLNPYVTFDLLSAIRGVKSQKFSLWGNIGIGGGYSFAPMGSDVGTNWPVIDPQTGKAIVASLSYMVIPLTLTFEYAIKKNVSIGAYSRFMITNTDYLESIYRQNFVDFWQTLSFVYRYKFITKDRKHFRDELFDYQDPVTLVINNLQNDIAELKDRLDDVEDKLDTLDNRLDKIEGIMAVNGPDTDMDGVQDVRDLEPNTPRGKPVDFWGRMILPGKQAPPAQLLAPAPGQPAQVQQTPAQPGQTQTIVQTIVEDDMPMVFFDFDRYNLDKVAQIAIFKVAQKMKKNPSLLVEVRGYCDDPGGTSYNQRLSQRRSEEVKRELIRVHGVPGDRIIANGRGRIPTPPGKVQFNRRCDFFFSK